MSHTLYGNHIFDPVFCARVGAMFQIPISDLAASCGYNPSGSHSLAQVAINHFPCRLGAVGSRKPQIPTPRSRLPLAPWAERTWAALERGRPGAELMGPPPVATCFLDCYWVGSLDFWEIKGSSTKPPKT